MRKFFQRLTATRDSAARRTRQPHLRLEALDDRCVPSATNTFVQTNLVSDQAGVARVTDPNLVNPWGISLSPTGGAFWLADNQTGVTTLYGGDVNGSAFAQSKGLPVVHGVGSATGTVFNPTDDFVVKAPTGESGPAAFLFASEDGTITGWNPKVPASKGPSTQAQFATKVDGAVFKGLALADNTVGSNQGNFLYAADFHGGKIDVFDKNFQLTKLDGSFTDPHIPAGYAPFNVQAIGDKLYVTYARQDADRHDEVDGVGKGFVDVFDTDGHLLSRLASGGALDAPWGVVQAPKGFGRFGGDILVGNFGNGHIEAFDPNKSGPNKFAGELRNADGNPLSIPNLWGLTFGNGVSAGDAGTLYFAAGVANESHGLFGSLKAAAADVPPPNDDRGFHETNLVSNVPGLAPETDPNLVNPWGFVQTPGGRFRVAANGSGDSLLVTAGGQVLGQPVTIPAPPGSPAGAVSAPTGAVRNTTGDFAITEDGRTAAATVLFATEDGTIAAFNPRLNKTEAVIAADQSAAGAVFKGLALASNSRGNFLFATDFHNGTVDVFDKNFQKVMLGQNGFGTFTDPNAPGGFAPFGIQEIGGKLFVTYAKQQGPDNHDDQAGAGNGFIDEFDTSGHFIRRFASGTAAGGTLTQLNSPFGLAVAPPGFGPGGKFGGALLVGNFGDSHVSAFDLRTGAFLGQLSDSNGNPLTLNGGLGAPGSKGLWAIGFGNGYGGASDGTLFFTAGINDEADGLFGEVTAGDGRGEHGHGSGNHGYAAWTSGAYVGAGRSDGHLPGDTGRW